MSRASRSWTNAAAAAALAEAASGAGSRWRVAAGFGLLVTAFFGGEGHLEGLVHPGEHGLSPLDFLGGQQKAIGDVQGLQVLDQCRHSGGIGRSLVAASSIVKGTYNPFIYFNF